MATITNTCLPHYTITNTWHISYSLRLTLSPRSIWWSVETIERLSSEHSSLSHSPSCVVYSIWFDFLYVRPGQFDENGYFAILYWIKKLQIIMYYGWLSVSLSQMSTVFCFRIIIACSNWQNERNWTWTWLLYFFIIVLVVNMTT